MSFVYLAINDAMPGLVKIGKADDVQSRMASLAAESGVPMPFTVVYQHQTEYAGRIEIQLHDMFAYCRVPSGKEFFRADWRAVAVVLLNLIDADRIGDSHDQIIRKVKSATIPKKSANPEKENVAPALPAHAPVRDEYIAFVRRFTAISYTGLNYAKALEHLGKHHLNGQNVFDIKAVQQAQDIYRRLSKGGDLYDPNRAYNKGEMSAAMGQYVKFLQQRGG